MADGEPCVVDCAQGTVWYMVHAVGKGKRRRDAVRAIATRGVPMFGIVVTVRE